MNVNLKEHPASASESDGMFNEDAKIVFKATGLSKHQHALILQAIQKALANV